MPRKHVSTTPDQANGRGLGQVEAGDAEAGERLEFPGIGFAVLVRVLPDTE